MYSGRRLFSIGGFKVEVAEWDEIRSPGVLGTRTGRIPAESRHVTDATHVLLKVFLKYKLVQKMLDATLENLPIQLDHVVRQTGHLESVQPVFHNY